MKTSKFHNFHTIGPNATKQSPCIILCKELSDNTKNVTKGHLSKRSHHHNSQTNKQNNLIKGIDV